MFSYCEFVQSSAIQILTIAPDGLAAAAGLSFMNYFLLGWAPDVDGFYMHSFELWLACTLVFPGAGNIGFTLLEYRLGQRSLLESLVENFSWVPFLCVHCVRFFDRRLIPFSQLLLLRGAQHPSLSGSSRSPFLV